MFYIITIVIYTTTNIHEKTCFLVYVIHEHRRSLIKRHGAAVIYIISVRSGHEITYNIQQSQILSASYTVQNKLMMIKLKYLPNTGNVFV